MAITTNAPTVIDREITPHSTNAVAFAVNAYTADCTGNEILKAAPAAGYSIVITQITVDSAVSAMSFTVNANATALYGPVTLSTETTAAGYVTNCQHVWKPTRPVKLTAATSLNLDAGKAGAIHCYVEGYVVAG
jgi:hypothetical protein